MVRGGCKRRLSVTTHKIVLSAFISCSQEDADELAMLKRVEEITDKLLRESFPDAYKPAPAKRPRVRGNTVVYAVVDQEDTIDCV